MAGRPLAVALTLHALLLGVLLSQAPTPTPSEPLAIDVTIEAGSAATPAVAASQSEPSIKPGPGPPVEPDAPLLSASVPQQLSASVPDPAPTLPAEPAPLLSPIPDAETAPPLGSLPPAAQLSTTSAPPASEPLPEPVPIPPQAPVPVPPHGPRTQPVQEQIRPKPMITPPARQATRPWLPERKPGGTEERPPNVLAQSAPSAAHAPLPLPTAPAATSTPTPAAADLSGAWRGALAAWLQGHKTYPEAARRDGAEGRVVVRFALDRDGAVRDVTLVRSSGFPVLDDAAMALLRGSRLPPPPAPAPDSIFVTLPIRYSLAS